MRSQDEQKPVELSTYRELNILTEIEENPRLNQRQLSMRVGVALGLTNVLLRNLVLGANVGYAREDFQGGATNRTDNEITAGVEAKYWLSRNFYVGAAYDFTTVESDAAGEDFTQNVVMIRGGAQF